MSKRIDLAWMIRTAKATPGQWISGSLNWSCGGQHAGSISYTANMEDTDDSYLRLSYWRGSGEDREHVEQKIRLVFTEPHYGGRRWWMICPYKHIRVAKLYLPNGGDRFASRKAWRLAYNRSGWRTGIGPLRNCFAFSESLGASKDGGLGSGDPRVCGTGPLSGI